MSADWGNYIAFGLTKPITETAKPVDTTTFLPSENVKEWGKYLAKDIKVASSRKTDESKRQDIVHPTSKVPIFFDYYIARGLPKADESISQSVKSLKPFTEKPTVAWATYLATGLPTNTPRVYNEVKRQEVEKISSTLQVPMLWAHYLAKTMKQATELLTSSAAASTEASKQYVAAETVQEYGKYIARGVPAKSASSSTTVPSASSAETSQAVSPVTPAVVTATTAAGPAIFYGSYISRGVPKDGSNSAATETLPSVNPFTFTASENEKEWGKYIAKGVSLPTTAPSRVTSPTVYPVVEISNTSILWGDYIAKGKAAAVTATATTAAPVANKKKDMTVGHYLTHSLVPDTRVLSQINSFTPNRPEVLAVAKKTTATTTEGGVTWSNYIAVGVYSPKATPSPVTTTSTSTATPAAASTTTTGTSSSLTGKILHAPSAILHSMAGALSPHKPHTSAVPAVAATTTAETSKEVSSVAVSALESTAVPVTSTPVGTAVTDAPVAVTETSASSASASAPTDTAATSNTTPPTTAEVDQKIASLGTKVKNLFSNIFGTSSSSSTDRSSVSGTSPERK